MDTVLPSACDLLETTLLVDPIVGKEEPSIQYKAILWCKAAVVEALLFLLLTRQMCSSFQNFAK